MKMMSGHITKVKDEVTNELQKISNEVNSVMGEVDKQLAFNHEEISDLSTKMTDIFDGHDNNWSDVVKREVDKSLEIVSGNIQEVQNTLSETRAEADEQRDKESRKNNIILYKVPESSAARAEDRNKEDHVFMSFV